MRRKWLPVTFILVLIFSLLLTACSGDDGSEEASVDTEPSENFNETGFPVVEEPVTYTMMGARHALVGEWSKLQFFQEMEKMTNVKFEFNDIPLADYQEKKNLALASEEIPDVFFGGNLSPDDEMTYGSQGVLIPLEDLIEKYAPNIQKMFDENPAIKKSVTTPDGHIYALPSYNEAPIAQMGYIWMNGEWLNNLGITEMPETTDDVYELLKRLKTEDPNQNGEADEIPMTSINMGDLRNHFLPAFGVLRREHVLMGDEVVYGALQPEYKAYVEYMNKLWEEELIDQDSYSQTFEQKSAKGHDGRLGLFAEAVLATTIGSTEPIHPILPPITSPTNDEKQAVRWSGMARGTFAITKEAENPEVLIRWVDHLYSPEGEILVHYGLEDHLWEWADEAAGIRKYIEFEDMNAEEYRGGVITPAVGVAVPMWTPESVEAGWDDDVHQMRINEVDEKLAPYGKMPYPDIYLTQEERAQIQGIETDLNTYLEQMEARFITGEEPMENWDTFTSTIESMGVDLLLEIYQDAYDRWDSAE